MLLCVVKPAIEVDTDVSEEEAVSFLSVEMEAILPKIW
jgi:hypothetical protein